MHELNGPRRTLRDTGAAAVTDGRFNIGGTHNVSDPGVLATNLRHPVGANAYAGETTYTLERIHDRHAGIGQHSLLRKNAGGARSRRLSLSDRLIQELGIVGQPGHKDTLGRKIDRAQLDVRLQEEAIHAGR